METPHPQCSGGGAPCGATLTVDMVDLLSRLNEASQGEGMTTAEIAEAMMCGEEKVRKLLKMAIKEGRCRPARKTIVTMAGTQQNVHSYVLTGEGS